MEEIEYKELFEKIINKKLLKDLIMDLEDTYRRNNGWIVGKITVSKIDEDNIKVTVPVTKYKIDENDKINRKTIIKIIKKEEYNNVMNEIYETYSEEDGYTTEEPEINELNNSEIIVRIPIKQKALLGIKK